MRDRMYINVCKLQRQPDNLYAVSGQDGSWQVIPGMRGLWGIGGVLCLDSGAGYMGVQLVKFHQTVHL